MGMSDPPCSSSFTRGAQCSFRNPIPRMKPFAQSFAQLIPFSSSRSSGKYTSPDCKVSTIEFQWRIISDKKSLNMGCAENLSSRTISPPQISGRYSLGGTSSGQQIKADKKPSSCSKFIARLSPKRSRIDVKRSNSASVNDFDFTDRPWLVYCN